MIHGSSKAGTAGRPTGQDSRGRGSGDLPLIYPPPCLRGRGKGRITVLRPRRRSAGRHRVLLAVVVPTEGEGTADQRPMAAYGQIGADLVRAPAQGIFRLLIALFHPHPQAV